MYISLSFVIALLAPLANGMNSTDDWWTVRDLAIVTDLPQCVQPCVSGVNEKIILNNGLQCQSYGCVCAESTQGLNFQYGLSNVTECVREACGDDMDVEIAREAFQDLCVVYVANQTQPSATPGTEILRITSRDYPDIAPCAKFALNGCLDENGDRTEQDCGPINTEEHWEDYRGVAAQRQCHDADCLCKKPLFNSTLAAASKASEVYCNMYISTKALPNEKWEQMVNVIATFCTAAENPPKSWWLEIEGVPQSQVNTSSTNTTTGRNDNGWTRSDKIQVGFGVGVGVPGLLLTALCAHISWKALRWAQLQPVAR